LAAIQISKALFGRIYSLENHIELAALI